jgi:hypothetical protein
MRRQCAKPLGNMQVSVVLEKDPVSFEIDCPYAVKGGMSRIITDFAG